MQNVNINKKLLMLFSVHQHNLRKLGETIARVKEKNEHCQRHRL